MRLSSALMFLLRRHRRSSDSFLPNAFFSRRHLRLRVHVFTMPVHDAIHLRFTEDFSKKKKRKLLNARALFLPRFSPFPFLSSRILDINAKNVTMISYYLLINIISNKNTLLRSKKKILYFSSSPSPFPSLLSLSLFTYTRLMQNVTTILLINF